MPRLNPFLNPFLMRTATPEHRVSALQATEDTLRNLQGLCRKLDLPPTAMELVADIYHGHLDGIVGEAEERKVQALSRSANAKLNAFFKSENSRHLRGGGLLASDDHGEIYDGAGLTEDEKTAIGGFGVPMMRSRPIGSIY